MKNKLLLLVFSLFIFYSAMAQNPVHWHYYSKKIDATQYQLHFFATIDKSWHTYSLTTPDGGPDATKISYQKNPLIQLKGATTEVGDLHSIHDESFGVDVKYFDDKVDFVQLISLKAKVKTKQAGTIHFMVCNDHECLPPKTIDFSIDID